VVAAAAREVGGLMVVVAVVMTDIKV